MSAENYVLYEKKKLPAKLGLIGWGLLIVGIVLMAVAYLVTPERALFDNIFALMALMSLGFGTLFLIALEHIVGSDWSVPFRRIAEILAAVLFAGPILAIPLWLNFDQIFIWTNEAVMDADKYIAGKAPYLNEPFFWARSLAVFLLMFLFYWLITKASFKLDKKGLSIGAWKLNPAFSALFMPVFAVTITVFAIDWVMTLSPKWFSTIFGVYYFAGSVLMALAVMTIFSINLQEKGYISKYITQDHYYNFGALMFAFVNFWAYIAFSQFLLIWYANIPDEVMWYQTRMDGGWEFVSLGLIFIKFGIPYMLLVTRPSKSDPFRLKLIAAWIIFAHLYDLYWMILPEFTKIYGIEGPVFGWQELAVPILIAGFTIVVFSIVGKNKNLMPVNDPKFVKGLEFHL